MPNLRSSTIHALFYLVLAAMLSANVYAAEDSTPNEPAGCERVLVKAHPVDWIDLEKALEKLDLTTPSGIGDDYLLPDLMGKDMNAYVQAELFILKYTYQRAQSVSAARIFMERVEALDRLSRLYENPELFLRPRQGIHRIHRLNDSEEQKNLRENFARVTRKAFLLTLVTIANEQPFLVLKDERLIPMLVFALFAPRTEVDPDPSIFPQRKQLIRVNHSLSAALERESRRLATGRALHLTTRTKTAIDKWNYSLGMIVQLAPERKAEAEAFSAKLGFALKPVRLPRGLF